MATTTSNCTTSFGKVWVVRLNLALAVVVGRHGHYHGTAHDPAAIPDFDAGRVEPVSRCP